MDASYVSPKQSMPFKYYKLGGQSKTTVTTNKIEIQQFYNDPFRNLTC